MLTLMVIVGKCSYEEAQIPDLVRADFYRQYPDMECLELELLQSSPNSETRYKVKGDAACMKRLRVALEKRGYRPGTGISDWILQDSYYFRGYSDPHIIFNFDADGKAADWIRVYS